MAERSPAVPEFSASSSGSALTPGDMMIDGDDIYGDGVNIAARLETMSEPGGIGVSARVQEDASGRLDLRFEDLGERQLKNIARPACLTASSSIGQRRRSAPPRLARNCRIQRSPHLCRAAVRQHERRS